MSTARKPDWLRVQRPSGRTFTEIRETLRDRNLHTVCEEASCPNLGECWSGGEGAEGGTATFMLLGDACTRNCGFCDVETGNPRPVDPEEPENVAAAVTEIGLDYVVLTSVDRDDLPDQGADHFARTVEAITRRDPDTLVEVLIPDFQGEPELVDRILEAEPDVVAHNVETVRRLQGRVRDPRAGYDQSLSVLERVAADRTTIAKTSIMLGLGERPDEVYRTLADCRERGVEIVTLGQYLRPSSEHLSVEQFVHPHVFDTWRSVAEEELEFRYCASGPMVRSSYRAGELFVEAVLREGLDTAKARDHSRRNRPLQDE